MNILLLTAHSILEYDELRILHSLGHNLLSIGAYLDPANPSDDKRPALPEIPAAPAELRDLVANQMVAKSDLPDEVLDWADTVIVNFFTLEAPEGRAGWLTGNWQKFKRHGNRVIWRTAGQSNPYIEHSTRPLREDGLEIVRYSPKERTMPYFAGEDAVIRFGKYPDEYGPWSGDGAWVANVTQNLAQRGEACGYPFWLAATDGLEARPAGPGSAEIGGVGELAYPDMLTYLARSRAYLYTGTQPASYTLGLMEAMLVGVPVVSIGPAAFGGGSWVSDVFEGHEIVDEFGVGNTWSDDPERARLLVGSLLADSNDARSVAEDIGQAQRQRAVDLFGAAAIAARWREFLA